MAMKVRAADIRLNDVFAALTTDLQKLDETVEDEATRFALNRLFQRMKKRAEYVNPLLIPEALEGFVTLNESLKEKHVDVDPQILADARYFILCALQNYNTRLDPSNIQVSLDLEHLYDLWKFSPGATQHAQKQERGAGKHAAEKITAPFTTTWKAVPWVYNLRKRNHYFRRHDTLAGKVAMTPVQGSILSTVPKNQEKVRTVAKEPLGNMLMQLAAGDYLAGVLATIGLRIDTQQPKNKALALWGSKSGKLATLDMKSASDMILPELVRALFPREWYDMLMDLRSEYVEVPGKGTVKLNMISTMGNGFTFPLMTLILTALIYGMRAQSPKTKRRTWIDWTNTAVYGDDIIVPTEEAEGLVNVLTGAGFVINLDKSYIEGPFRESCGGDYWNGIDVTPFYITELNTNPQIYVAINKVLNYCARHKVTLCETLLSLKGMLRGSVFCVAEWDAPDSGIQTCDVPRRYKKLQVKKQTHDLIDREYLMPLAIGGYVESSNLVIQDNVPWEWAVGESWLSIFWKYSKSVPRQSRSKDRDERGETTVVYCPQPYQNEYRAKECRLPRGYLTGWDPVYRSREASSFISAYVGLIFS